MGRRRRRWTLAVAAVGALALASWAGLSQLGGDRSPGVALAEAAGRAEGESARVQVEMTFEEQGEPIQMSGEGVGNADGTRGRFDFTYRGEQGQFRMEGIVVGDEMWFRAPVFRRFMPPGKRWVHVVDETMPIRTLTPSQLAEMLADSDDVREVSDKALIDGRSVTHYAGTLQVGEVADELGGESGRRLEAMAGGEDRVIPVQAWVSNESGLPVRATTRAGSERFTADMLEYGVPVDVEPPPAHQVIEENVFDRLTGEG